MEKDPQGFPTLQEIAIACKPQVEQKTIASLSLIYEDGLYITTAGKIYVPAKLRSRIIEKMHFDWTSGHQCVSKTERRLRTYFYWPKLKESAAKQIKSCIVCRRRTKTQPNLASGCLDTHSPWKL